jgi:hypothetical protein
MQVVVLVVAMSRTTPSRLLSRDGTNVLLLNQRLSLTDRVREADRQLFALALPHELARPA